MEGRHLTLYFTPKACVTFSAHARKQAPLIAAVLATNTALFYNVAVPTALTRECRLPVFRASNVEALK